jgi:hypothetical protein
MKRRGVWQVMQLTFFKIFDFASDAIARNGRIASVSLFFDNLA